MTLQHEDTVITLHVTSACFDNTCISLTRKQAVELSRVLTSAPDGTDIRLDESCENGGVVVTPPHEGFIFRDMVGDLMDRSWHRIEGGPSYISDTIPPMPEPPQGETTMSNWICNPSTDALDALHKSLSDIKEQKVKAAARSAIERMLPQLGTTHKPVAGSIATSIATCDPSCEGCQFKAAVAAVNLDALSREEMVRLYEAVFDALSGTDHGKLRTLDGGFVVLGGV